LLTTTYNLQADSECVYHPWIKVVDSATGLPTYHPPTGFIQGRFAFTDRRKNIAKAPAGITDGKLIGAIGVESEVNETVYDTLYPVKINCIQALPEGICIMGSRTLGASDELGQISKRRVMNYAIDSIEQGTRFVLFENNDSETRRKWHKSVSGFLLNMWRDGLLEGASAAEAYYVICDESNNPATVRKAGKFRGTIGLHFKDTIEFVEYTFEQDNRAINQEIASQG